MSSSQMEKEMLLMNSMTARKKNPDKCDIDRLVTRQKGN